MSNIQIRPYIDAIHQEAAAQLFATAFESKFTKLLGDKTEVSQLFKNGIHTQRGLSALSAEGELLGIVGFQLDGSSLIDVGFKDFIRHYGFFKGIFKCSLLGIIFHRTPNDNNTLLMDGIAVKEGHRGKGIGKMLFQALEELAIQHELSAIQLDVIDENAKAKKLYEKIGFTAVKHQSSPAFIQRLIGVSGATTMVKKL